MSDHFPKEKSRRMRDAMSGYVDRGDVPGIVTLVSRQAEVRVEVIGAMAMGSKVPIQRDSIFRITSMTKPMTAAAALILIEEGKLGLDEPIEGLLPELSQRRVLKRLDGPIDDTVPAKRAITVRDLLTFRMGFGQLFARPDAYPILQVASDLNIGMGPPMPGVTPAPEEWLRRLGSLPLMCQPGERWMYNTGSDVLGVLIARASGQTLEAFLRERLFEPLGMHDTGFSVPASKIERLPISYWNSPKTGAVEVFDESAGGQWSRPPAFASGAGGLVSTLDDCAAFARMMLNGGAPVLSRASVDAMTTDQLSPAEKAASAPTWVPGFFEHYGWGLGVAILTGPDEAGRSIGTFGWDGGMGTSSYVDPKEGIIGILMTQRAWTSPTPPAVHRDFWHAVYA